MQGLLQKKNIHISAKRYFIDALGAMAYGLFASLLVGTILNSLGQVFHIPFLTDVIWPIAQKAAGPAMAVAIGMALQAPSLVLYAATLVGFAGNDLGGPVGVYLAAIVGIEMGKLVFNETPLDIILTPSITAISGIITAVLMGPPIDSLMTWVGEVIVVATEQSPILMGALVSTLMGIVLTLPISSAAICMMLGLDGLAAGAATVGCCCQMVGFAVISYEDNGLQGLLSQGLGTSMLQMPNIVKKPLIWIPASLASAILGPLATRVFQMENTPLGAGMGASGLVGQLGTLEAMAGQLSWGTLFFNILLLHIVLPGAVTYSIYYLMKKQGLIQAGDMKLDMG